MIRKAALLSRVSSGMSRSGASIGISKVRHGFSKLSIKGRHAVPGFGLERKCGASDDFLWPCLTLHGHRYAGEQLDWLTAQSESTASQAYLAQLAARRGACRARGGADASIPMGESTEKFVGILSSCKDSHAVDGCLAPVLAAH